METEISEKESSSKSWRARVAVLAVIVVLIAAVAAGFKWWPSDNEAVVAVANPTVGQLKDELINNLRFSDTITVYDPQDDSQFDEATFGLVEGECAFDAHWARESGWTVTKTSSRGSEFDFTLANPDAATLRKVELLAYCFAQTDSGSAPTSTP